MHDISVGYAAIDPAVMELALVSSPRPQAGFPSPAADFVEDTIDLNQLLVTNPPATFFVRIEGESLKNLGILSEDIAAVDRSKNPRRGDLVVAVFEGGVYVKVLDLIGDRMALCSRHDSLELYQPMFLDNDPDHIIWGVVTGIVRGIGRKL
ncbi:DNA polymerase V subunit D [Oceanococcus atlanticus]|uniref:DNA polymerase V subunit D n=1 Tax=Oceanococcus atlanticus TaxID=1317117 RepID=A0A1Y1SGR4_9GAMM|nr:translesion error-prone DNA polymerase V autoproteolytic subunit [Oceanococcus atlanticus]ORE88778.1 DNA polymerase V subunit D [Oceanococcus atlanticus]